MKRKSLLIMLLVALFVPLAMNAQNKMQKRIKAYSQEMKVSPKEGQSSLRSFEQVLKNADRAIPSMQEMGDRATETSTVTASRITASSATWTGSAGESWGVAITCNSSGLNQAVTNGYAQYGTQRNPATSGVFSTSGISGTITSVAVDCASYSGRGTVSVTVGGSAFGSSQSIPSWTNNAGGTRTFTGSASGEIKVTMTNASNGRAMYIKSITVTYEYDEGCVPPTNFAATNVTTNSATFSWTENGTSDTWVIFYMSEEDTQSSYVIAETNPYTLTGLEQEMTYYAMVVPYCGDIDQESDVIEFTTETNCPKPTNLSYSDVTMSTATVSWNGEGNFNLQYRPAATLGDEIFYDDFENDWLDDMQFTTYTQGDAFSGYGWFAYEPTELSSNFPSPHSGSVCAMSLSYASSALNADNYLVTPQVALGGELRFWVMSNYADNYEVLLSTGTNAIREFTTTLQSLDAAPSSWTEVVIDLSRYAGQQGYIAIHHSQYDGFVLFVDDFGIYGEGVPAGPWVTINNVSSPYTITGLNDDTEYEWQVQSDCGGDGESVYVSGANFTTRSACDAPTGLNTTNITNNSATLNWTAVLNNYSVRYRKGFVYDFESAEPWTYTDFTPCTTYDGDQYGTYGFNSWTFPNAGYTGACIAFNNDNQGADNMYAHGGNAFGVMFDAGSSSVQTNDWFILPELTIESGDFFTFWGREITDQYGAETINVGVYGSTDGTFSAYLAQNVSVSSTDWTEYSYDLSSYVGQTIRLAINCVSQDIFGFMFDDIFVGNPSNDWSTPVSATGGTYPLTGLDTETYYTWQVQGADCDGDGGTTSWASDYFTTLSGIPVESISASDVTVLVGETATITPTVLPAEATNPAVTYTSGDETVATVDADGVVTGVTVGTTTITIAATDGSNVTTTINVTVNGIDVTGITAENVTVVNGQTATITYTVTPNNATDASVTFTSADPTIATVDADGVVTGVSVGETTITIASVSNPDVTATITVTVTSDPNAVQFTVNAPAIAAPGDVITVEAVLTAPENYSGFTDLLMAINYDHTAFEFVTGSIVYGPVVEQAQQYGSQITNFINVTDKIQVSINCYEEGYYVTAEGVVFSAQFTVLAESGEFTFTGEPNGYQNFDHEIEGGGGVEYILYEFTPSTVEVAALETYELPIVGWNNSTNLNYYLIASPIGEVAPSAVTNMLSNTYDLYYFDNSHPLEWINYDNNTGEGNSSSNPGFNLVPGKGYLYANIETVTLTFTGRSIKDNTYTVELNLAEDGEGLDFPAWNLVGNPFAVNAWIADGREHYTLDPNGDYIASTGGEINRMEGVFVIATEDEEEITFTTTQPTKSVRNLALNLSNGQRLIDRAIVRFDGGNRLPKLQFRQGSTKIYIPMDGQDYAVVGYEEMGEMPVNFKAESNGTYTLSMNSENVGFAYLHLIDNMTGADVNLLETPSYSFEACTTDYESRFKLVFATGDNSNSDNFAFFSNGNFVINNEGEATLQVIDVTGRILSSESINGCANVNVNGAAGVYMLRLVNGDNVKVQKVVVK